MDEAAALPFGERLRLVQRQWEGLQPDSEALPLSDGQLEALDRRAAEMERDPRLGSSREGGEGPPVAPVA